MVAWTPATHGFDAAGGAGELMKLTSFETFTELAQRSTFVPVVKEMVADLLTPVSAFLRIAENSDYAFLLESVEGGEHVGRYSFLGKDPFVRLRSRDRKSAIIFRSTSTNDSAVSLVTPARSTIVLPSRDRSLTNGSLPRNE